MLRVISVVFAVAVFSTWLYFQNLKLNMFDWSQDAMRAQGEMLRDLRAINPGARGIADQDEAPKPTTVRERMLYEARVLTGELAFDADRFVRNRKVTSNRLLFIEDVLNEGETPPPEAYEALYMKARAALVIRRDCADLLEQLALECRIAGVSVKKKRSYGYSVSGALRYKPAYDLGEPQGQSAHIIKGNHDLTSAEPGEDSEKARRSYLSKALTICEELKDAFGNCFISSVDLALKPTDKRRPSEGFRLHAMAEFSVHGIWSDVNKNSLANKIEQVAGTIDQAD